MNFLTEVENLSSLLKNTSLNDNDLKELIQKCQHFTNSFFPIGHDIFRQLNDISIEPKGSYFPEMYQKLKTESLKASIQSINRFLAKSKDEFERLLIEKPFEEIIKNEESQFLE